MDLNNTFHEAVCRLFRSSKQRIQSDNMPSLVRVGTRRTLADVFADIGFNKGVEVGTKEGAYSMELCKRNPNLHLCCVDPWIAVGHLSQSRQDGYYNRALSNLKPYNVTIIRKFSMDALSDFEDDSLDFVFIDGAHDFDNAIIDIIGWSKKVKLDGVIACHDYMSGHGAGVMKAVDAYTHCHKIEPWFVTREMEATAFWQNIYRTGTRPYKSITVLRP